MTHVFEWNITETRLGELLRLTAFGQDIPGVETMLRSRAPVDAPDEAGVTALIIACMRGYTPVVERLLAAKADTSVPDKDGYTALRYAAAEGYDNVVNLLLAAAAQVDFASPNGTTPLMEAVRYNRLGVCEILLKHKASVEAQSSGGLDVVMAAATAGSASALRLLGQNGAARYLENVDNSGWTALQHAVIGGDAECLQYLLVLRASVNHAAQPSGHTALLLACARSGREHMVDMLIKWKADLEARTAAGRTPLMVCAVAGLEGSCRLLIENTVDANAESREAPKGPGKKAGKLEVVTALSLATEREHTLVISLLLRKGANPVKAKKKGKKKTPKK